MKLNSSETASTCGYSIFRQIDSLGRIVIPKEIRDSLYWNTGEISTCKLTMEQLTYICLKIHVEFVKILLIIKV